MPKEKLRQLRARYYDNRNLVEDLTAGHAPVLFAQLAFDWPNVQGRRDELWQAIPGPKRRVEIKGTTHYLNAFSITLRYGENRVGGRLLLSDVRMAGRVRTLVRMIDPWTDRPASATAATGAPLSP